MQHAKILKPSAVHLYEVKHEDVFINPVLIAPWKKIFKRSFDIVAAFSAMIILLPLILYVAIRTKLSSKGKIIYSQIRVGIKGNYFRIYKFRSMYNDAEKNGPALSCENDKRITSWGKKMRKWRLDELPQLWNILKGEMSFVGPRPERRFYINQINQRTNNFKYLLNMKPGLTSWGMVQFGYASNIDEILRRMQYDLDYVENFSILFDLKIMLFSIRTIFLGKGK